MKPFTAQRTYRKANQSLQGSPDEIFPLLCPVREYDWIDGWDCKMIFSDSGVAELDCIFKTSFPDQGPEEVWVIDRYEPPHCIQFIRVNPLRVIRYRITLSASEKNGTDALWEQTITALNEEGDRHLSDDPPESFSSLVASLEQMINYYLKTGRKLEPSPSAG